MFATLGNVAFGILDDLIAVPGLENWPVIFYIFCAVIVLPDLSMGIRRLHDTGRRGWLYIVWILVTYGSLFIPEPQFGIDIPEDGGGTFWNMLGAGMIFQLVLSITTFILLIVLIVLLSQDSQSGQNTYGPNPKGIGNSDVFS